MTMQQQAFDVHCRAAGGTDVRALWQSGVGWQCRASNAAAIRDYLLPLFLVRGQQHLDTAVSCFTLAELRHPLC